MKILPFSTEMFFKKAVHVAECYGFSNIDDVRAEAEKKNTTVLGLQKHKSETKHFDHHIFSDVVRKCNLSAKAKDKQPLLFYTPSTVSHASTPSVRINALTLNAVGTNDPLAEVILLKSAMSILRELGVKNHILRINCIGDRDSSARFLREATSHFKNRNDSIPEEILTAFKTNPGSTLSALHSERHPLISDLPSPIEYLTSPSRKYFKDILELLQNAGIPFELADKLYADPKVYSHTIFEIIEKQDSDETLPLVLARGGRYDELTRPFVRGIIPSMGAVIAMRTSDKSSSICRPRKRKANACLVHIGREARLRSIEIIETFREKKIPIEQCLYFDRFSEQMAYAHAQKTKYIIIIGQQEARDGVVLIRDTSNHSQQTIPISSLPAMLKVRV